MRSILFISTGVSFVLSLITPSLAATVTQNLTVQATVSSSCSISSLDALNFGTITSFSAPTTGTTTIGVTCSNTTPYNIGLDAGLGAGATVATRIMKGPSSSTLNYSLYQNEAASQVWGDTIGTDTVEGTGTGTAQNVTIYASVFSGQTPAPGSYTDTVVATVTY